MNFVLTKAFESWVTQCAIDGTPARPDVVLFARMGRDPEPAETMPPDDRITHRVTGLQYGRMNSNTIVCSATVADSAPAFAYDWICLAHAESGTLCAVIRTPLRDKAAGETLIRNFAITYSGIAKAAEITTPPQSWQMDINAWLKSSADQQRQTLQDFYGHHVFIDGAALTTPDKTYDNLLIAPGIAYLGGLRVELQQETIQWPPKESTLYLRAWIDGHEADGSLIVAHELYLDAEPQRDHPAPNGAISYVAPVARVFRDPHRVEDLRLVPSFSLALQANIYDRTPHRTALPGAFGYGALYESAKSFSADSGMAELLAWLPYAYPGRYFVEQGRPNGRQPIISGVLFKGELEVAILDNDVNTSNLRYKDRSLRFLGVNGEIFVNRFRASSSGNYLIGWENLKLTPLDVCKILRSSVSSQCGHPDVGGLVIAAYLGASDDDDQRVLIRGRGIPGSRLGMVSIQAYSTPGQSHASTPTIVVEARSAYSLPGSYVALSGSPFESVSADKALIGLFMRIS